MSGTGEASASAYLERLADHVDDPARHPATAVAEALRCCGEAGATADEWVERLACGDAAAWGRLLAGLNGAGAGLRDGIGARLLGLSPFAGTAFVTAEFVDGTLRLSGDVGALLATALRDAGHEPRPGARFVLAVDPRGFSDATALCMPASPGD